MRRLIFLIFAALLVFAIAAFADTTNVVPIPAGGGVNFNLDMETIRQNIGMVDSARYSIYADTLLNWDTLGAYLDTTFSGGGASSDSFVHLSGDSMWGQLNISFPWNDTDSTKQDSALIINAGQYGIVVSAIDSSYDGEDWKCNGTKALSALVNGDIAIYGKATQFGIYSEATGNYGVYGHASSYGVYGHSTDFGVYGEATGNYGIYGQANNFAVYGVATGKYGVYGLTNTEYGVYGEATDEKNGTGKYGLFGFANNYAVAGSTDADGDTCFWAKRGVSVFGNVYADTVRANNIVGMWAGTGVWPGDTKTLAIYTPGSDDKAIPIVQFVVCDSLSQFVESYTVVNDSFYITVCDSAKTTGITYYWHLLARNPQ